MKLKVVDIEPFLDKALLCYVDGDHWAYFTTQALDKQWGDDWNDVPYEHNAGRPYTGSSWEIVTILFSSSHQLPGANQMNSPYSVEKINADAIPWLKPEKWDAKTVKTIYPGTSIRQFIRLIIDSGGHIYLEME